MLAGLAALTMAATAAITAIAYADEDPAIVPPTVDADTVNTVTQPAPTPSDDPSPNTGSIVGGVSAGVIVLMTAFGIAGRKRTDKQ
ncbi:MAG: hypothetical protein IKP95_11325 [Ruminococcus sp.]|nr:hypothetical protein [Ruminococcus sp.]